MAPSANQLPQGALATVLPTMPTPTLPPTGPEPPTLKLGQWIMDPSKYVLILTNTLGLVLYFYYHPRGAEEAVQVVADNLQASRSYGADGGAPTFEVISITSVSAIVRVTT